MRFFKKQMYEDRKIGEYIVERKIGEGRYGICFTAHSICGEKVNIKKHKNKLLKKSDGNINEAVILSKLSHTKIPEFLGVINEADFYGYILEYKSGTTVDEMIFKNKHKFDKRSFFSIGIQLIEIITYLHKNGVVHRDIRIPNVLIDKGVVYLIDFGLARVVDDKRYITNIDFGYLGDFLLYVLYSSFETTSNRKKAAWYNELDLSCEQVRFFKKLLELETTYESIEEVSKDFKRAFIEYIL